MSNIEPHLLDSEPEIEQYLASLLENQRIQEVPEHLPHVAPKWRQVFLDRAKELGWVG